TPRLDESPIAAREPRNPEDRPALLENRPARSLPPRHFGVDEDVLELLRPAKAERTQAIAGLGSAHDDRSTVERGEIEYRPPAPGSDSPAAGTNLEVPAGNLDDALAWNLTSVTAKASRAKIPDEAPPTVGDRSSGERDRAP